MCGILGWLGARAPDGVDRFETALDTLVHRGPDDGGVWSDGGGVLLGHRRLSIIDLSSAGHQPMLDPASGAALVFNGEIYNYVELGKELKRLGHRLRGNSDTEVLLHALIEWGVGALQRLNGMWAFAFWRPDRRQLLLARDRFGVKPLYYRCGEHGFAFASEPKALLSLFPEHRSIEEKTLLDFLGNNLLYARGQSFYTGIDVVPPAHFALYDLDDGAFKLTRYWDYPQAIDLQLTGDEALEEFSRLFSDAVRVRLRSDVPIGITLSGGLDSTGVLAAATGGAGWAPTCFTSVYAHNAQGERHWAELASKAVNASLIPVAAPKEDWLQTLRKISWHMDAPGYSPAVYPLWHLMKRARAEGVPVLLEGQGADEALAGYPQYAVIEMLAFLRGRLGPRDLGGMRGRLSALQKTFSLRWAFAWALRELSPAMLRLHRKRVGFESLIREGVALPELPEASHLRPSDPVGERLLQDHSRDILPGLLHYGDAMSMAHGIETRNPFLDYRLVEWMFRMPPTLRFRSHETKWVLREYLRNHGQARIGNRPDKKGYPTPVGQWMAALGNELEYLLCDAPSPLHTWCNPQRIRRLIAQNRAGGMAASHHLYKILSTQLWIQECVQKKVTA
jgi:asparagine synthase (glutamine-hydrolysing)